MQNLKVSISVVMIVSLVALPVLCVGCGRSATPSQTILPILNVTIDDFPAEVTVSTNITGTAYCSRGIEKVGVIIERLSDGKTWNGQTWTSEGSVPSRGTAVIASGSSTWYYNLGAVELSDGSYRIYASCKDQDSNYSDWVSKDLTLQGWVGAIKFVGVRTILNKPSQVQFVFSLRDQDGHAIIDSPSTIAEGIHIYENGQEIDYRETSYFVDTAANFALDAVLVLDFTKSLAVLGATQQVVDGAKAVIDILGTGHRIAIVEYHDRNVAPQVLCPFTADVAKLKSAIDQFYASGFLSGSSLCWDAVYTGISLFPVNVDPNVVKVLLLLSDGFDTSSIHTPSELIDLANSRGVQVTVCGYGDVKPENEKTLVDICEKTGGSYYKAPEVAKLTEVMQTISRDLQGQYKVGYITLRTQGKYTVKVVITYKGVSNYFEVKDLDLGSIFVKTG